MPEKQFSATDINALGLLLLFLLVGFAPDMLREHFGLIVVAAVVWTGFTLGRDAWPMWIGGGLVFLVIGGAIWIGEVLGRGVWQMGLIWGLVGLAIAGIIWIARLTAPS